METRLRDLVELQIDAGMSHHRVLHWSRFDAEPDSWTAEFSNLIVVLSRNATRYRVALRYARHRFVEKELPEADSLTEALVQATQWACEQETRFDALDARGRSWS